MPHYDALTHLPPTADRLLTPPLGEDGARLILQGFSTFRNTGTPLAPAGHRLPPGHGPGWRPRLAPPPPDDPPRPPPGGAKATRSDRLQASRRPYRARRPRQLTAGGEPASASRGRLDAGPPDPVS